MAEDQATQLSQRVERDVRMLIGDLHMQLIVQRALLEMSGVQAPQQQQQPAPGPETRTNGATPPRPSVVS